MAILFREVVFGPVKSRRFGKSLGINILPLDNKLCNFNCIYCECGWTDLKARSVKYPDKKELLELIEKDFIKRSQSFDDIDCITFAGNGEPTMHPDFAEIIEGVAAYRNKYLPGKKIVVLSNAALLGNSKVFEALKLADERVLKLDAGTQELFSIINGPLSHQFLDWYIKKLMDFKGQLSIQTLFLKGTYKDHIIDNSQEKEVNAWLMAIERIQPKLVMIYTIDRDTPATELAKVSVKRLHEIAKRVETIGIPARVYE